MEENRIELNKVYRSEVVRNQSVISSDKVSKKRPSWVRIKLDEKITFIKIIFNGEAFWYRRYFLDYFFILSANSKDYKNYYNEIAENYESYVPQNKKFRKMIINFVDDLKIKKDSKILDLGAGTGIVTEGLAEKGYSNLTLLDISEKQLGIARKKESLKDVKYQVVDLTKEQIKGKFDLILETMSLDYFDEENMKLILKKIQDALADEGKFIVIDRHVYPEFSDYFKEIRKDKVKLETPEGTFDYFYFIGEKL